MVQNVVERTFDWRPRFDPRSLNYPIRGAVTTNPVNRTWRVPAPLDQGAEGACVGFGWTHELMTTPVVVPGLTNEYAAGVYHDARRLDEWPGEDYDGTSVLAGAKVLAARGYLKEYRWAKGIADVELALGTTGPVVLGINWYSGMDTVRDGVVSVSGHIRGGHCILARAYRKTGFIFPDEPAIGLLNSWGNSWGVNGQAWIKASQLSRLLDEDGEACVPFRRSYGRK